MNAEIQRGFDAGINEFILQPIDKLEFLTRIEIHLESRDSRRLVEDRYKERIRQLDESRIKLEKYGHVDEVTGLKKYSFFLDWIEFEAAKVLKQFQDWEPERHGAHFSGDLVLMRVDLVSYDEIVKEYGYQAGDRAISRAAHILSGSCWDSDLVLRQEGRSFLLVLRDRNRSMIKRKGEEIGRYFANQSFQVEEGKACTLNISIGFAVFPFCIDHIDRFTWQEVLDLADLACAMARDNETLWVGMAYSNDGAGEQILPPEYGTSGVGFPSGAIVVESTEIGDLDFPEIKS